MNTKHTFKYFLKKTFKSNPLSYLGWLGVLGIIGLICVPTLIPFLICFTFFSYTNMIADELFWSNVRTSAGRAFWVGFIFDTVVMVGLVMRGLFIGSKLPYTEMIPQNGATTITMSVFNYGTYTFTFLAFVLNMIIMLLTFSISMLRLRKQEKLSLEDQEN